LTVGKLEAPRRTHPRRAIAVRQYTEGVREAWHNSWIHLFDEETMPSYTADLPAHSGEVLRKRALSAPGSILERAAGLVCKIAQTPDEIEQIHRINYQTFVEEIPQHSPNPEHRLVDRFHAENLYLIVKHGSRVIGMMALRDKRPFSMDAKVSDFERYLPPHEKAVEMRLLAVERDFRGGATFRMMMDAGFTLAQENGWDLVVISAAVRQLKLYRHIGFEPFGALVGTEEAPFQPMYLRAARARLSRARLAKLPGGAPGRILAPVSFIPGPVPVSRLVQKVMAASPLWHRSDAFRLLFALAREKLCQLTRARHCQIFPGSGTLANDMVAWRLRALERPGLILVNGEFGERIAAQARRAGLDFETITADWGQPLDLEETRRAFARLAAGSWVWGVHHETSTGILNPLAEWQAQAAAQGLLLCVDAISAIGNVPLALDEVYLATATSGKGLCSYPGLGIVFHRDPLPAIPQGVPAYLDIGLWAESDDGIPFTHSSNLLAALATALDEQVFPERIARIALLHHWLRRMLREMPFTMLAAEAHACPAILTLLPEAKERAWEIGVKLEQAGFLLNYRSACLRERNWFQISLMGLPDKETLTRLAGLLREACLHP
jgi:aspartate aminotransferase-like enzyme